MSWQDSQSLSVSINEGLEEGFVVGDGLQDVPVSRHVADGPLAQPGAAQPEDVAERETHGQNVFLESVRDIQSASVCLTCPVCG